VSGWVSEDGRRVEPDENSRIRIFDRTPGLTDAEDLCSIIAFQLLLFNVGQLDKLVASHGT
jgi:hypothetical protein